jgi:[ribosomal protein S5]-alanine N-acetyltransferase
MPDRPTLVLRKSQIADKPAILLAYQNSVELHHPWVYAPKDIRHYLKQKHRYFICLPVTGEIVGTFNISGMVRGNGCSAVLSYAVFQPHQGRGYMTQGLQLLLHEAFHQLNLQRLEATIQSGNAASIRLVSGACFVKAKGDSNDRSRADRGDQEHWAIMHPDWATSGRGDDDQG